MGIMEQLLSELQKINKKLDNLETGDKKDTIYNVREAAAYMKVKEGKVYELIRNNKIDHIKIGTRRVITESAMQKYIADHTIETRLEGPGFKNDIRMIRRN